MLIIDERIRLVQYVKFILAVYMNILNVRIDTDIVFLYDILCRYVQKVINKLS